MGGKKVVRFTVEGAVPSKSNYRYSRRDPASRAAWKRIKNYEEEVGKAAMVAGARYGRSPLPIALVLTLINQKCDLDNSLKAPIDALKQVVVPDDTPDWIPDIRVIHIYDGGEPRIEYSIRYMRHGLPAA